MSEEWTDAHRREALRRTYEIAAWLVSEGRENDARSLIANLGEGVPDEETWRAYLYVGDGPAFSDARIDHEVRRVRALAEGRLVRETVHRVRYDNNTRPDGAWDAYTVSLPREKARKTLRAMNKDCGWTGAVVRVTRIRRAR